MKVDHSRWWLVLAGAGAIFALAELADGFVALPLREWSSLIATAVLQASGMAVERSGTIISTGRLSFDVVPACSGSTTLQVMLMLGLVWGGTHPRLSGWRRAVAMTLAAPLAVVVNGIRVAALVALGDMQLQPVEGFLHSLVGLCTFSLGLGVLVLCSEWLATDVNPKPDANTRLILLVAMLCVLAIPMAVWSGMAWVTSPLDQWGWLLAIAGVAYGAWAWRRLPHGQAKPLWSLAIFGCGLVIVVIGTLLDINIVHAGGILIALCGLVAMQRSPRFALALAPMWLVLLLALPISGFALTRITGLTGPSASLLLRFGLAGICLIIGWRCQRACNTPAVTSHHAPVLALALAGLALAIQIGALTRGRETNRLDVSLSYLQGQWSGDDLPVDTHTALLLGRDHLCTRRYHHAPSGKSVDVIMTSTGGDRHRAHPPEYCLTGAGWQLQSSDTTTLQSASLQSFPAARRVFELRGERLTLLYWFSDGKEIRPSYMSMLADDTWRRLRGQQSDWILIRLISSDEAMLRDFSGQFSPTIRANTDATP